MKRSIQYMTRTDLYLILIIGLSYLGFIFFMQNNPFRQIDLYVEIIHRENRLEIPLIGEDRTFVIDELPYVTIKRMDDRIAIVQSDCADQICVHTGWLQHSGAAAVCLPNEIMVRIR